MLNWKKILLQNIQVIWDTVKRPNLRILEIEEGEETYVRGTENILEITMEERFLDLKKWMSIKAQEAHRTPNGLDQKRKSPWNITIKALYVETRKNIKRKSNI